MSTLKPNRRHSPNDVLTQLSKIFSSDDGYRILNTIASEEYKLLQETKRILEERIRLDEEYAEKLQKLTASADRIAWPITTHPIASSCRELLMEWSHNATAISSNADVFQRNIIDDLLRILLEQKTDAKKFLDDGKRRYDSERQKAQNDVAEAEKRYLIEAKSYAAKNNELKKLSATARLSDEKRIGDMKCMVTEKRDNVYRAHNEYVLKIREYTFIDEQYVRKIHNLLIYHEEVQLILNKQWQNLLEAIANYMNNACANGKSLQQIISAVDARHCYDEICKIHSNIPLITPNPLIFNDILLQTSGLFHLKPNKIIIDDSTINILKQKLQILTDDTHHSNSQLLEIPQIIEQIIDKQTPYYGRKCLFEQEQQAEYLRVKIAWEENLKNDLQELFEDSGIIGDDPPYPIISVGLTDRLEDQAYFHGHMPRIQSVNLLIEKGDYLIRINEDGKIVLSILWDDPARPDKLKDQHFYIHEQDNVRIKYFYLQTLFLCLISDMHLN